MPFEEKYTWVLGVLAIVTYAVYAAIVIPRLGMGPVSEIPYIDVMLWTIGGSIVASIIVTIILGMFSPKTVGKKDARDREIYRHGEYIGQWFVIAGAIAALIMAWLELDWFWIANVIYLAFVLAAVLGFIVKAVGYRAGLPRW